MEAQLRKNKGRGTQLQACLLLPWWLHAVLPWEFESCPIWRRSEKKRRRGLGELIWGYFPGVGSGRWERMFGAETNNT